MWVTRRELARLERELSVTRQRADTAEQRLAEERSAKDWLVTQLASRLVTKSGGYGLAHEPPAPLAPHPRQFTHEPSVIDLAKLEYYKDCARRAGKSEQDAEERWAAEMRGEELPIDNETEN
jgi:hypothetical protein